MIIAFAVPAIRTSEHVPADIDRTILSVRSRNFNHDEGFPAKAHFIDIAFEKDVDAGFLAVMDMIPEFKALKTNPPRRIWRRGILKGIGR